MNQPIMYGILTLCFVNLVRMGVYMISSNIWTIQNMRVQNSRRRWHLPAVTVLVPAFNEERAIERCLLSLYSSDYPAAKLEVIIINDGSTDDTKEIIDRFKRDHRGKCRIRLINRPNKGKAAALNYVLRRRNYKGSLIMCLDADSSIDKHSLRSAVQYFRRRNIVALSSNVNIVEDGSVLALLQRLEYLIGHQMKKGQSLLGVDYIIGGVGSIFRRTILEQVAFYDTNTLTEDIDLTMKIIMNKKKDQKIAYAADSIVYTEAVHSVKALIGQRFRWKYGRSQTFLKHKSLFFSRDERHSKRLAWFMLPFTLLQDAMFMLEPLVLGWFLYITLRYGEPATFASAICVVTAFFLLHVLSSTQLSLKERLRLSYYTPPMYLMIYILSFADYCALIKSLFLSHKLKKSITNRHITWRSPERKESSVVGYNPS